ncbi:MAG: hypothetical protein Q9181_007037, partial [Wetmoreana brouardii]
MESLQREVVFKVIARCKCRIREQAIRLENSMRFIYGDDHDHFIRPETVATGPWDESTQDIKLLGSYCEETQNSYMHLCEVRMKQFKEIVARVVDPSITSELDALTELSKLAYDVRRSSAFKHFTQANLNRQPPSGISLPTVSKIIDRIGQISKIYRAALTMTAFVTKVKELGKKIVIEAVPTSKIQIPELEKRTVAQLGQRAGRKLKTEESQRFKHMLDLWPRYRQHAELQLIVFYEENPRINLGSKHIGCSKQSCYLCYSFIQHHGLFEVDGGHQSLYSLWTIKDTINFESPDKAQAFWSALRMVCHDLELKVQGLRATQWHRLGFATANESVPNLSRISLALATNREVPLGTGAEITSVGDTIAPLNPPARSTLTVLSQSHLAVIPEAPPKDDEDEETMGHDMPARTDQPTTVTADSRVSPPLPSSPTAIQVPSSIAEPLVQPTSSTTHLSIVVPDNPVLPLNAHSAAPVTSPDAGRKWLASPHINTDTKSESDVDVIAASVPHLIRHTHISTM